MTELESLNSARKRLHEAQASLWHHLYMFGDELKEKEGYDVDGLEAIYYHLFDTRGLLPEYTSSLSLDALKLLLQRELKGWTIPNTMKKSDEMYENIRMLCESQGELDYITETFGDYLAKREKYDSNMGGREALELYLCRRHHYRPTEVSAWSFETIAKLLDDEISAWSNSKSRH